MPAGLAWYASGRRWIPAKHLMLVNDALLRIAAGQLRYLAVEWPPRHGKSEFISKNAPAWFVGRFGWPVMLASYEYSLAASWSAHARNVIRDVGLEVFGVGLGAKKAENWWEASNGGAMMSAGVGGPITGKGGRVLVIDDPVKNAEEAHSEVYRKKSHEWYDSTWQTRLEPGGAEIVTGTRWHEEDLIGYVLGKGDKPWEVIRLPAMAEEQDVLGREPGAPLWEERYDTDALQQLKDSMSSYWWNALYQQRPTSDAGAIFKREYWQRYRELPSAPMRGGIYCDTAGWEKKLTGDTDYGVIAVWKTDGVNFYVVAVYRGRWEFPEFVRRVKDVRAEHNLPVKVEKTPWALPLIQQLQKEISGIIPWEIEGRSKENRARAVQHYAEGMNVYIPEKAAWVSDWIDEHAAFPNGSHDDQVDTTTMALLDLGKAGCGRKQVGEEYRSPVSGVRA